MNSLKVTGCALLLAFAAFAHSPARADDALFNELGGEAGIGQLMEAFVPRLKSDPQIGHFFKETSLKHLVKQLSDQVCEVSGGPCKLDAPSMKEAHADMGIAPADFNRLVELLQDTMEAQHVPFRAQNRLLARLAPMHRDIVAPPAGAQ